MKPTLFASLLLIALAAAACGQKSEADLLEGKTLVHPPKPPFPSPPPVNGPPYAQYRAKLLAEGYKPAGAKVRQPANGFPDLDCWRPVIPGGGRAWYCEAAFTKRRPDGWTDYYIVETSDEATPHVAGLHEAAPIEGYVSIPPPFAPDIPKLPVFYASARVKLLDLGFRPIVSDMPPYDGCIRLKDSECTATTKMVEVDCSGTGVGFCYAGWLAPDGRRLRIITIGEPQPHDIYNAEWLASGKKP